MLGGDQRLQDRPRIADEHRRLVAPGQLAHLTGVGPGQLRRHVAGHRGDAQKLQFLGGNECQQDRQGAVLARIAVEDDRPCHRRVMPPPGACFQSCGSRQCRGGSRRIDPWRLYTALQAAVTYPHGLAFVLGKSPV